ncbi:hypothetical protein K440DRAFT_639988 [Wilcoxina mikolae CBS 423.85]|nr:hypothetical protein K440DRAFT_639988 [Wilcoxina mikolae CBS 423.85]
MAPISLSQGGSLLRKEAAPFFPTPDILSFALAEGVDGSLGVPSIWFPSSEEEKLVFTVTTYEEVTIEFPVEFYGAPDQTLEISDHKDSYEDNHENSQEDNHGDDQEDASNTSSAELRRRFKRDALPSPEPGIKEFWDGIKNFGAKLNPARLWRPAERVEETELTATPPDRKQQPSPEEHSYFIPVIEEDNPWKDHEVNYNENVFSRPWSDSGSSTRADSGSSTCGDTDVHVPPAPPVSLCDDSKASSSRPPAPNRYPFCGTPAQEIAYLESERLVTKSELANRVNAEHLQQKEEAQRNANNEEGRPTSPGRPVIVPLDGTGENPLSVNPRTGRVPGSRPPVEPGKPAPGRLDPALLAKFEGRPGPKETGKVIIRKDN